MTVCVGCQASQELVYVVEGHEVVSMPESVCLYGNGASFGACCKSEFGVLVSRYGRLTNGCAKLIWTCRTAISGSSRDARRRRSCFFITSAKEEAGQETSAAG